MLNNLIAEYTRKNITPYKGVMTAISCAEKTARNKLNGISEFTVPEAIKIMNTTFKNDGFTFEYLFEKYESVQESKVTN